MTPVLKPLQGYLAFEKAPPRRTLQCDHAQAPMAVQRGGVVSYERGTAVAYSLHALPARTLHMCSNLRRLKYTR